MLLFSILGNEILHEVQMISSFPTKDPSHASQQRGKIRSTKSLHIILNFTIVMQYNSATYILCRLKFQETQYFFQLIAKSQQPTALFIKQPTALFIKWS